MFFSISVVRARLHLLVMVMLDLVGMSFLSPKCLVLTLSFTGLNIRI